MFERILFLVEAIWENSEDKPNPKTCTFFPRCNTLGENCSRVIGT